MTRNVVGGGQPTEQRRVERCSIARSGGVTAVETAVETATGGHQLVGRPPEGVFPRTRGGPKKTQQQPPDADSEGGEEGELKTTNQIHIYSRSRGRTAKREAGCQQQNVTDRRS